MMLAPSSRRVSSNEPWISAAHEGVRRQADDPDQAVDGVAHAQRLELPRLLEHALDPAREAQHRDDEEQRPEHGDVGVGPGGGGEHVAHRLGAAAGEVVAVDEALRGVLAPDVRQDRAGDDRERDERRQGARRERDGAIEARDALEAVDRAQHEGRAQPERQRPQHPLAIDPRSSSASRAVDRPRRHGQLLVGVAESVVPGRRRDQGARIPFAGGAGAPRAAAARGARRSDGRGGR